MDIYMDRLAQRLTAQDIIQANTVADMEEMNKLKAQISEYHRCLEELKRLMDEETAKLRTSQMSGENVNRLVDEGIEKIRAIQADSRGGEELQLKLSQQLNALEAQVGNKLDALQKQVNDKLEILQQAGGRIDALEQVGGKLDAIEQQIGGRLDTLGQQVGEKLGAMEQQMSDQLGSMNQQVGEKLNGMNRQVGTTMEKLERRAEAPNDLDENKLTEKFATLEDNVHKECVKVYRNVQAVVVEENTKQSDAMTETMTAVGKMKGKTGAILGISVAALLASLGSIILQLMQVMGII